MERYATLLAPSQDATTSEQAMFVMPEIVKWDEVTAGWLGHLADTLHFRAELPYRHARQVADKYKRLTGVELLDSEGQSTMQTVFHLTPYDTAARRSFRYALKVDISFKALPKKRIPSSLLSNRNDLQTATKMSSVHAFWFLVRHGFRLTTGKQDVAAIRNYIPFHLQKYFDEGVENAHQ